MKSSTILFVLFLASLTKFGKAACSNCINREFIVDYTIQRPSTTTSTDGIINLKVGFMCNGHIPATDNAQLFEYCPFATFEWKDLAGNTITVPNDRQHLLGVPAGLYEVIITPKNTSGLTWPVKKVVVALDNNSTAVNITNSTMESGGSGNGSVGFNVVGSSNYSVYLNNLGNSIGSNITSISNLSKGFYNLIIKGNSGEIASKIFYIHSAGELQVFANVLQNCGNIANNTGVVDIINVTGDVLNPGTVSQPLVFNWCDAYSGTDHLNMSGGVYTLTVSDASNRVGYLNSWINSKFGDLIPKIAATHTNPVCGTNTGVISLPLGTNTNFNTVFLKNKTTGIIIRSKHLSSSTPEPITFNSLEQGEYQVIYCMGNDASDLGGCTFPYDVTLTCCPNVRIVFFYELIGCNYHIVPCVALPTYTGTQNFMPFPVPTNFLVFKPFMSGLAQNYFANIIGTQVHDFYWFNPITNHRLNYWDDINQTSPNNAFHPDNLYANLTGDEQFVVELTNGCRLTYPINSLPPLTPPVNVSLSVFLKQNGVCIGSGGLADLCFDNSYWTYLTNLYSISPQTHYWSVRVNYDNHPSWSSVVASGNFLQLFNSAGLNNNNCPLGHYKAIPIAHNDGTPFTLTFKDGDAGCEFTTGSISLSAPDPSTLGTVSSSVVQSVNCANTDGEISVSILIAHGVNDPSYYDFEVISNTVRFASDNVQTHIFQSLPGGSYAPYVNVNGCWISSTPVFLNPAPQINLSSTHTNSCPSLTPGIGTGSIDLTATCTDPLGFNWSNGAITEDVANIPEGNYLVTVTDQTNLCTVVSSVNIGHEQPLSCYTNYYPNTCDIDIFCQVLGGKSPFAFNWSYIDNNNNPGSVTTSPCGGFGSSCAFNVLPGNYYVTVTDACGQTASSTIPGHHPYASYLAPTLTIVPPKCHGGNDGSVSGVVPGVAPPINFTYSKNGIDIGLSNNLTGLTAGTYNLKIENAAGCLYYTYFTIPEPAQINATVATTTPCQATASVSGGTAPYNLTWQHLNTNNQIDMDYHTAGYQLTNALTGNYNLLVEDANHCVISRSLTISPSSPTNDVLMAFRWAELTPPQDPTTVIETRPANEFEEEALDLKKSLSEAVSQCIDQNEINTTVAYKTGCLEPDKLNDHLDVSYALNYHHYTLYYYDRSGNLTKTVPPQGVHILDPSSRALSTNHDYITAYEYNSLGEVREQSSPDTKGEKTNFLYDNLGRLKFSQNPKQTSENFSYTLYDDLGRIIEVGEAHLPGLDFLGTNGAGIHLDNYLNIQTLPVAATAAQITRTFYTEPAPDISFYGKNQTYLRNRVSYTYLDDDGSDVTLGDRTSTYYSYDPYGNVQWLVQDIAGFARNYISYEYDLISNKILKVNYNETLPDQFFHKYKYDEDNRLREVYTSKDNIVWEQDSKYSFYKNGPLQRTQIGQDNIQGVDYAYTLQGWLKGMNTNDIQTPTTDLGKDGVSTSSFMADVFGMALGYYNGDFQHSTANFANHTALTSALSGLSTTNLFNGNISWMATSQNIPLQTTLEPTVINKYRYDRLNRITGSDYARWTSSGNWATGISYHTKYSYDHNGNILSLSRNGEGTNAMDDLSYKYQDVYQGPLDIPGNPTAHTNRLNYVDDVVMTDPYADDISAQPNTNYGYDPIGNLTKDESEGLTSIEWNVYGKIKRINKSLPGVSTLIDFKYDAMGNRVAKIVTDLNCTASSPLLCTDYTYYVRDATGNVMATYSRNNQLDPNGPLIPPHFIADYKLKEIDLYGSSRLGLVDRAADNLIIGSKAFAYGADDVSMSRNVPLESKYWGKHGCFTENTKFPSKVFLFQYASPTTFMGNGNSSIPPSMFPHNNISIAEDKTGESPLWSATFRDLTAPGIVKSTLQIYNASNNLIPNQGFFTSAYFTKSVFFKRPGDDKNWCFSTIDDNGILSISYIDKGPTDYVVNGAQIPIALPAPLTPGIDRFGHHLAVLELPEEKKVILYATVNRVLGNTYTKELYAFEFHEGSNVPLVHLLTAKTININLTNIKYSAFPEGEIQISADGKKLLWSYFNTTGGGFNFVSNKGSYFVDVYDLSSDHVSVSNQMSLISAPNVINSGNYINSADFSPDGKLVFFNFLSRPGFVNPGSAYIVLSDPGHVIHAVGTAKEYGEIRKGMGNTMIIGIRGVLNKCLGLVNIPTSGIPVVTYVNAVGPTIGGFSPNYQWLIVAPRATGALISPNTILHKPFVSEATVTRNIGKKRYELTDHLGNTRVVVSDLRLAMEEPINSGTIVHKPEIVSSVDYYPFGMVMPGRSFSTPAYKYGFNGQEKDDEITSIVGAHTSSEFWEYDTRLGRRWNGDQIFKAWQSPYSCFNDNPIYYSDPSGMDGEGPNGECLGDINDQGQVYGSNASTGRDEWGPVSGPTVEITALKSELLVADNIKNGIEAKREDNLHQFNKELQRTYANLDWIHGQVQPPASWMHGNDIWMPNERGDGWEVNSNGYLTKRYITQPIGGAGILEWIDGGGELKVLKSISEGRALLKEGDYFLYWGIKGGKPYIGSTNELIGRYTKDEIEGLGARVFSVFRENPSLRMPNRGIAIGFEQMVIKLNNGGEIITKANKGKLLANQMNAAIREIYLIEAEKWATKNVPNWQNLFKIK